MWARADLWVYKAIKLMFVFNQVASILHPNWRKKLGLPIDNSSQLSSHCSLHEALRIWLGSFLEVSGWSLWLKLIESAIYRETKTELGTREKMITKPREVHCIYVMQQQHLSLSIDISSLIASLNAGSTKNKF